MKTTTSGGNRSLLTLIDNYYRYTITYLMKQKNETSEKLKEFVSMSRNKLQCKPGIIRTDNGGEYISKEVASYLKRQGILNQTTAPLTPEQNGVVERKNCTLVEMARCILSDGNLPHKYWGEAVMTATYLQNRLPSRAIKSTPFEMWHGSKPSIGHIRVFGCKAYAYIPSEKRSKLENRAIEGILVGYSEQTKGYRNLHPKIDKVTIRCSVYFDETPSPETLIPESCEVNMPSKPEEKVDQSEPVQESEQEMELTLPKSSFSPDSAELPEIRRSTRTTKGIPPHKLSYTVKTHSILEPTSWEDIEKLPKCEANREKQQKKN